MSDRDQRSGPLGWFSTLENRAIVGLPLLALLALFSGRAWCQSTTGQISGKISDPSGMALAGAEVLASNTATGVRYPGRTDETGYYFIPFLPPGPYQVAVNASGFKQAVRSGLTVLVNETARIDVTLEIGSVHEQVTVSGSAPLIETENASVSTMVQNRAIVQLPLSGLNVFSIIGLAPGAADDNAGYMRINGTRARGNDYLVDGVTQLQPEVASSTNASPPLDSVEEVRVLTSNYSAEYGHASGGIVNVVSKSGTNELHSTLWEFLQNDKLNAANFFRPPSGKKPVVRRNQFGGVLGGPVYIPKLYDGRNRTFFFFDYEGNRFRGTPASFNVTVPTAQMRAGDLSQLLGSQIGTDVAGRSVFTGQIFDPASERTINGQLVRDPFPNNQIPQNRIDPVAKKLLSYWPDPTNNQVSANFATSVPNGSSWNRYDIRIDQNFGSSNRIFGRFTHYASLSNPSVPFHGYQQDVSGTTTEPMVSGTWVSTITPNLLSELRLGYMQTKLDSKDYFAGQRIAQTLGIPNINSDVGLPHIGIPGVAPLGDIEAPWENDNQRVYSIIENLSLTRGRHSLKTGIDIRFNRLAIYEPEYPMGEFDFVAGTTAQPGPLQQQTGAAWASFLLGLANTTHYTVSDPGQKAFSDAYAAFFQDDWKATDRLTLNLGLRYELNTRVHDPRGYSSTFDPNSGRVLAGAHRPDVPLATKNFGPRLGLAYDVFGHQKTLIRGGYGIFYQPITGYGGTPLQGIWEFPFGFTSDARSANVLTPISTLARGPVIAPQYDISDPKLGYGTDVFVQGTNQVAYVEQWSFGIEQQLSRGLALSGSYIGTGGRKLDTGRLGYININQVTIQQVQQAARDQGTLTPKTAALLPWPNFGQVNPLLPHWGNSNYNALQLSLEQRLRAGISFFASYTWSHSIDNGSEVFGFNGGTWPQDVYNLSAERATSTADVPQRFVAYYVWDLPFGAGKRVPIRGLLNQILGGWQLSGVCTAESGHPVDVEQAQNTMDTYSLLQRPNLSGNPNLPSSQRSLQRWFDTSLFSAAAPLSPGTSPRNPIRAPGLADFDSALHKMWHFQERRQLEFRWEMFNFTNTPFFGGALATRTTYDPSRPLSSQSFGKILTAGGARSMRFGLKLTF